MCLRAYKDEHDPVWLYIYIFVCFIIVFFFVCLNVRVCVCVRADSALTGSAAHHTLQPTADYTALVLSSLYSVLCLLSAWERTQS